MRKIMYAVIITLLLALALLNVTITGFSIVNVQANATENITETIEVIVENNTEINQTDLNNSINETTNETFEISQNETFANETAVNETIEQNETVIIVNETETVNQTSEDTISEGFVDLIITLDYPERITRGELLSIKAIVLNQGTAAADNVNLVWSIPAGFQGIGDDYCGFIDAGGSCIKELVLQTDVNTPTGLNRIKVSLNYE